MDPAWNALFLSVLAPGSFFIGVAMKRGYFFRDPDRHALNKLEAQRILKKLQSDQLIVLPGSMKVTQLGMITPNEARTKGYYSKWRSHSTHEQPFTAVWTHDETQLVSQICSCGAQLPPQLFRDPDGYIVDVSWEPITEEPSNG